MRDQIVKEWKRIGLKLSIDEAYLIAETNMKECESYSYIDPFLVLAMQCIESGFTKKAKSPMGALGINQIMPSTGRLLASHFKLSYSDSLLYDIKTSIKLSVKLFDILYAQYKSWELVLADYNGGPWQAYYYSENKSKLSPETKNYVPNVLATKKRYDNLFLKYRLEDEIEKNKK
jgi:soluble lytic murein transglycosylase